MVFSRVSLILALVSAPFLFHWKYAPFEQRELPCIDMRRWIQWTLATQVGNLALNELDEGNGLCWYNSALVRIWRFRDFYVVVKVFFPEVVSRVFFEFDAKEHFNPATSLRTYNSLLQHKTRSKTRTVAVFRPQNPAVNTCSLIEATGATLDAV